MDCPVWPQIDLAEYSKDLRARAGSARHPLSGTFEITDRCNLRCVHCYINQPAGSEAARARELAVPQIARIFDEIAATDCLYLLLTGGEIFLRPDFPEIYRLAKRSGMLVTLFSNGTLLSRELADFLAEWPPYWLDITIYGATEATFERVTQVPGSYAKCMHGIELAHERGLRLALKAIVMDLNRHELPAMRTFAQSLGVEFRYNALLWPRLDGGQAPVAHRLSAQAIDGFDQDDPQRLLEWQEMVRQFGATRGPREYVYECGAGHHAFHVDCSGRLSMCMMARRPSYDLLHGSFREGWDRFLGALCAQKRTLDTACRTCTIGVECSQCPGWSQVVHGDSETPVELLCELAHMRTGALELARIGGACRPPGMDGLTGVIGVRPRLEEEI